MTKMHILKKSFIDILSKYVCACYVLGARDIVVIELVMVHTQKELTVSWRKHIEQVRGGLQKGSDWALWDCTVWL